MAFIRRSSVRSYPEYHLQTSLNDWLSYDGRVLFFHPPNRPHSPQEWAKQRAMGARAGVADLSIPAPGSLFLELKAPGGRQSPDQVNFQEYCKEYGMTYVLTDNFDEACELVKKHAPWGWNND